ncbi:group I intron-associated PD-(D/E)XK endonuclease [Streptosporangium sp. NPDC023825]|uniref:group I intron-associated PD-(D/E)XK endonuclease n=1 Tax=Streptosporangium sp. NPDC023825 TaxID=3154909 RepID=UPI003413410A
MPTLNKHTRHDAMRWSDEDLASAISDSDNWSSVARLLGYAPTANESRKIMKARAEELQLDTSHFRYVPRPAGDRKSVVVPIRPEPPAKPLTAKVPRWTDDDLKVAVADSTSWREVARKLGYRTSSGGGATIQAIKNRAETLQLTSTHFSGNRRWSDDKITKAVTEGTSWTEVTVTLGVRNTSANRKAVTVGAARLNLNLDHLETAQQPQPVGEVGLERLREAATTIASAWFTLRGYHPSLPLEARAYDLLVDMRGKVQRVQIKTCMASSGQVVVAPGGREGVRVAYSAEDVDLFFILDGDLTIYLIPISEIVGKQAISLGGYRRFKVGSASSLIN